jgi:esterase/lipase
MKAMYFSSKNTSPVFRKIVGVITSSLSTLTPNLFMKLSYKVFLNPRGVRNYNFSTLHPEEFFAQGHHGDIKVYFFKGGGKHILLTHGWADTSKSFETLVSELLNSGFSVWSFDHAGHGKSEGSVSNLFAFIDGVKSVVDFIEGKGLQIYSLISHSMGGAALLNLEESYLKDKKVVLIAAPVKFFEEMFKTFKRIGVSTKALTSLLGYVSSQYNEAWEKASPMDHKHKIHENFFVIHDKKDKQCKYENMELLLEGTPAALKTSEGLGHRRVLKDEETLKAISDFLKPS